MKLISLIVLSLITCFLSSVQAAYGADTIAIDFALPSDQQTGVPTPEAPHESGFSAEIAAEQSHSVLSFSPPTGTEAPDYPSGELRSNRAIATRPPSPATNPGASDVPNSPALAPDAAAVRSPAAPADLFSGGSESLVARTVGHAEGTRGADGSKNPAYYGHSDPGNGVWNRGTFSYQFGNGEDLSPEEADQRQLDKLKGHYQTIQRKAAANNLTLNLEESLNAIDLANQAPLAVTESGGFVERLAEAKREKQLAGEAAILEGRVWAYWNPERDGWDAPGLKAYGANTEASIRHDQDRRLHAIARALETYRQEQLQPEPPKAADKPREEQVANLIIFQDLPN